jgi:hypothetical protein
MLWPASVTTSPNLPGAPGMAGPCATSVMVLLVPGFSPLPFFLSAFFAATGVDGAGRSPVARLLWCRAGRVDCRRVGQ